jgi:hypothetical protein
MQAVFCVVQHGNAWYADRHNAQESWSCLINAARSGQLAVVKCLVEVGCKELLMLVDKVCARPCICVCLWRKIHLVVNGSQVFCVVPHGDAC